MARAGESIDLITYHDDPPRIVTPGTGLTFDLAAFLNRRLGRDLVIEVKEMPRLRVDEWLADRNTRTQALVPWVNPRWFTPEQNEVMSISQPLIDDPAVVISRARDPVDYQGPESLIGKRFAGVIGHRYQGIDKLVEAGEIRRQDGRSFVMAIDSLRKGRVDATVLPFSSFKYIVSAEMRESYHVSAMPDEDPRRYLMVPRERPDLLRRINAVIDGLPEDLEWGALLATYQMSVRSRS